MTKRIGNLSTDLSSFVQASVGPDLMTGIGDVYFLAKDASSTSQWVRWLETNGVTESHYTSSLKDILAATTSYRNDTIVMLPGGYSQTAAFTWDKAYVRLIGACSPLRHGGRCRITHGVDTATLFNVTGVANHFKNIHWQWGNGSTTNKTAVLLSASQNMLEDCTIEGINATDMGGTQDYALLKLASATQATTLKRVTLGNWTVLAASASGAYLEFAGDNSDFYAEDLLIHPTNSSTSHVAIEAGVDLGGDYAFATFDHLKVVATYWSDSNTYISNNTKVINPPSKGTIFLDNKCCQTGYTDWTTASNTHVRVTSPASNEAGGSGTPSA